MYHMKKFNGTIILKSYALFLKMLKFVNIISPDLGFVTDNTNMHTTSKKVLSAKSQWYNIYIRTTFYLKKNCYNVLKHLTSLDYCMHALSEKLM